MTPFTLEVPPSIVFGAGTHARLPELLGRHGRRVLLCTGSHWFERSAWKPRLGRLLEGFEVHPLRLPAGEPEAENLELLVAQARERRPEVILAVGGGSVLDTAKAISGLLPLQGRVEDYLEGVGRGLTLTAPGVPWVAVPTTAGTGAEATKNAVIRARGLGYKRSLRSPFLLPACAVVDPELSRECPLPLTGTAGMDALVQLVESFVSRKASPIPRGMVLQAFPELLTALKALPKRFDDLEARGSAAFGALVSGITLANAGLGAAHGFASGLGGMYDIPHGLICALFIRPVLRFNADSIRADLARLQRAAAEREGGIPAGDPLEWLVAEIDGLFRLYDLPETLKGFGIRREDVPEISRRSSGSSMSGNPRELPLEERERMIEGLLE